VFAGPARVRSTRRAPHPTFIRGGLKFSQGQLGLADLAKLAAQHENLPLISGKQEWLENIINQHP
jgi:xylose isomerase